MTRTRPGVALAIVAVALVSLARPVDAQYADEDFLALQGEIADLSAIFPAFTPFPWTEDDDEASFLYGDTKGIVHHLVGDENRFDERWRSFPLEGAVKEVFAEDLDGDGRYEIIAYTTGARIYIWETEKYELLWESVEERFEVLQAVTIADVDRDPQLEMVIAADNKLLYYDGINYFREKEGRDFVEPSELLVADVDGDQENEIITNDGYVIDTSTLNIEWANDGFGYPMSLFDVNGDGVLDVVGEISGAIKFWDIEDRREIW